jgi:hypothetical protein
MQQSAERAPRPKYRQLWVSSTFLVYIGIVRAVICPNLKTLSVPLQIQGMDSAQLSALTIGINKYQFPAYSDLNYAREDADRFEQFLRDSLDKSANIISLRDEKADRAGILNAFRSLLTDQQIMKDNPIVIYYAGHGGRVAKPAAWGDWPTHDPGQIEIMCPSDIGTTLENGDIIEGIPDRTISSLLQELSSVKGDNIVSTTPTRIQVHNTNKNRHLSLTVVTQQG